MLFIIAHNFGDFNMEIVFEFPHFFNIQVFCLWQFQSFTNSSTLSLGWDTQWCIKSENTRFKHQRPHTAAFW